MSTTQMLLRCGICKEEIKAGRWRGLSKHVYLYHKAFFDNVEKWITATTPTDEQLMPTRDRIEAYLLRTGHYRFPDPKDGN